MNIKTVKRSNKWLQALELPVNANLNPRSVYNKVDKFHTFVEQEEVDILFMSELWERENLKLDSSPRKPFCVIKCLPKK